MQMIVSRLLSNYLANRKRSKEDTNENKYPNKILEFLQETFIIINVIECNK